MDASHGCVVVMEVNTGYVRAISNLKRNSDNTFSEAYNYAIGLLSNPGSTFKLAALMAALEDNRLRLDQLVDASGKYIFTGSEKPLYDSNGAGYGVISVQQAFEKSSNVLAPTINDVYKNDPYRFIEKLEKFYVTKPLGIKLAGEPTPKVSRPGTKQWSGISIPYMSIGYEIEQTPLQTLSLYNAVANNGKLLRPLFVQEIMHNGKTVEKFSPVVLEEQICSQATINKMKKCLSGVMKRGTGSDLKSVMFDIAGKTGTAKLIDASGKFLGRDESDYQASFCGFFPADKPLYSCIVVIYKPKKNIYGAKVSGTVFAAVANKVYASNLQYHKAINETVKKSASLPSIKSGNKRDITQVLSALGYSFQSNAKGDWVSEVTPIKKIHLLDNKVDANSMPDVTGMTAKDAVFLLESMGFITQINGYGSVVEQSVPSGSVVEKGRLIKLNLKN
jgi:cell division protein FtsI (penicillin-binding protein 3)